MGKAAIYVRVSTVDRQDYTRQISDCKESIGNKYIDADIEIFGEQISGYKPNEHRPQLLRMMNIIENDPSYFEVVYITEISRLGRGPKSTRDLIDNLTDKKIPIYITSINKQTLDEFGERDSIMNIIIQVLIEFADSESKTMKKRSKSGLLQSARNGRVGGGKYIPYGFKKGENKELLICDEESLIIKRIFELYKSGLGFKRISGYLNDDKIPTRVAKFGKQEMKFKTNKAAEQVVWVDKTVNDIVINTIYKGQRKYKGHLFDIEPIIDPLLFDECNQIIQSKTHRNSITTYEYLLKDLMVCGICGRNYFAKYKPQTIKGDKVYICSSRLKPGGNCGNAGINISYIESVIYHLFVESGFFNRFVNDRTDLIEVVQTELVKLNKEYAFENSNLQRKMNSVERLLELYMLEKIDLTRFDTQNDKLEKEIITLKSKISIIEHSIIEQNKMEAKLLSIHLSDEMKIGKNRKELTTIFSQFFKKIYVTKIDPTNMIIDIHMSLPNRKAADSLKMMIDYTATKYKQRTIFQYDLLEKAFPIKYEGGSIDRSLFEIYNIFRHSREYTVKTEDIIPLPEPLLKQSTLSK